MKAALKDALLTLFMLPYAMLLMLVIILATFFMHFGLVMLPVFLIPIFLSPLMAVEFIEEEIPKIEHEIVREIRKVSRHRQ